MTAQLFEIPVFMVIENLTSVEKESVHEILVVCFDKDIVMNYFSVLIFTINHFLSIKLFNYYLLQLDYSLPILDHQLMISLQKPILQFNILVFATLGHGSSFLTLDIDLSFLNKFIKIVDSIFANFLEEFEFAKIGLNVEDNGSEESHLVDNHVNLPGRIYRQDLQHNYFVVDEVAVIAVISQGVDLFPCFFDEFLQLN